VCGGIFQKAELRSGPNSQPKVAAPNSLVQPVGRTPPSKSSERRIVFVPLPNDCPFAEGARQHDISIEKTKHKM